MRRAGISCVFFSFMLVACGPADGGGGDAGDPNAVVGLEISPADAELLVKGGNPAEQGYTATALLGDGSTRDATGETIFSIEDIRLGGFAGPLFTASGAAGGRAIVRGAHPDGAAGEAVLTVRVEDTRVEDPAPADAPDLFGAAGDDPSRAPAVVYPADRTMVPPNLGDFEAHWTDPADSDLYEVRLAGDYVDLRLYVTGNPGAGSFATFLPEEWAIAGHSERGGELTVTVRGLKSADPGVAGTSAPITVGLTDEPVEGGIYYWASTGSSPAGIYRHDMGMPGEPAEAFYTTDQTMQGRCVACHFLSRDGSQMAVTFDHGDGPASILDVATKAPMLPTDGSLRWNFASFEPGGERLVTVYRGEMTLRESATGAALSTVPTPGYVTHPDFSPSGDAVVYVAVDSPTYDFQFRGGTIMHQPFDPATATFGSATTLVPANGDNVYYPSWSPDGQWILFNRSTEDAYDDASAEIWVVPADGSSAPVELERPNLADGLTNSWGRWAPFEQTLSPSVGEEESFFWFTFSSKRAFGVRLPAGRPQIWMAPFFPERLVAGGEPSAPAFRLPFQKLDTNNHIAQWTEEVVPIE